MNYETTDDMALFDMQGRRKYLTASEARRLLAVAAQGDDHIRLFCELLYYTGCRLSEALEIDRQRLDREAGSVVFRTLKRRKLAFRAVPVPMRLIRELAALAHAEQAEARLFPWSRQTGWRFIKRLMEEAAISGPQATPRGLRHQYGVHAIGCNVPESTLQRWMGHARLRNTHIYTFALGPEERALAGRMW